MHTLWTYRQICGNCLLLLVMLAGCRANQAVFQFQHPIGNVAPDLGPVSCQEPTSVATGSRQKLLVAEKVASVLTTPGRLPIAADVAPHKSLPTHLRLKKIAKLRKIAPTQNRQQPADQFYGIGYLYAFVTLVGIGILVLGLLSGSVILAILSSFPLLLLLVLAVMSAMGKI